MRQRPTPAPLPMLAEDIHARCTVHAATSPTRAEPTPTSYARAKAHTREGTRARGERHSRERRARKRRSRTRRGPGRHANGPKSRRRHHHHAQHKAASTPPRHHSTRVRHALVRPRIAKIARSARNAHAARTGGRCAQNRGARTPQRTEAHRGTRHAAHGIRRWVGGPPGAIGCRPPPRPSPPNPLPPLARRCWHPLPTCPPRA